jgi:hypothetical protein
MVEKRVIAEGLVSKVTPTKTPFAEALKLLI